MQCAAKEPVPPYHPHHSHQSVCGSTGTLIPKIGHGTAASKTRLPDTVMVCCERTGCNYSTHLFHLGQTLNSDARKAAELAIRQNHAWYCPRCSNSARAQKARSDGSDSENAETEDAG